MKFFLDSAILPEIEFSFRTGICDGVTMNPSLVKKAVEELQAKGEKITLELYIRKILKAAKGSPVSIEVTALDAKGMVMQGKRIYKNFKAANKNLNIKIPVNPCFPGEKGKEFDGIIAIKELHKAKIPVNCTLIFTPEQALAAAKAGADFVSPFCGRIDDLLRKENGIQFGKEDYYPAKGLSKDGNVLEDNGIVSGVDLVKQTAEIFKTHGIKSRIIAASVRNARQARECAIAGADICTMPFGVLKEIASHRLTQEGMKKFTEDAPEEYKKMV
ncbi:putative transaldolase [uncultured archaeon]|nr:putative transaldolase [uncultured archaeon]